MSQTPRGREKLKNIEKRREQRKAINAGTCVKFTYRTGLTVQSVISSSQTGAIQANCKNAGNTVFSWKIIIKKGTFFVTFKL